MRLLSSRKIGALLLLTVVLSGAAVAAGGCFYEVPVLMYHHVGVRNENPGETVSPESFERQMEFLRTHRYRVLGLGELVEAIKNKKPLPLKTVSITFDDGNLDNFSYAFPVLKNMGFPATVFMITSNINRDGGLSEEDLRIMDEAGVTIGSHTVHHAFLPEKTPEDARSELADSKQALEKVLGHPVTLFSYPAGGVTPQIRSWVEQAGYTGAVTTNYGKTKQDPYALHRIKISESSGNLFNFWAKVSGYYQCGKKRVQAK